MIFAFLVASLTTAIVSWNIALECGTQGHVGLLFTEIKCELVKKP